MSAFKDLHLYFLVTLTPLSSTIGKESVLSIADSPNSVRADILESAAHASPDGKLKPWEGWVNDFIYPGYQFRVMDAMVTNFHLPKSTLLMLVSAFAGKDLIFKAYREAIAQKYRFYSFGDAMLIL